MGRHGGDGPLVWQSRVAYALFIGVVATVETSVLNQYCEICGMKRDVIREKTKV